MNELDLFKKLLDEEKQKNAILEKELKEKKHEIEDILNNSAYETYRTVIESAHDIIFKTDTVGYFTYVNPAAEKVVGYDRDELIGMHFISIIRDDYRSKVVDAYMLQLNTKLPTSYSEFPVVKKDGSIVWVGQNVQPILVNGNIAGFNAIARDITEKITAQNLLQQNEKKYRSIIQNMNLGLLVVDNEEKVVDANPSFIDMMGYSREELMGKSAVSIFIPDGKATGFSEVRELRQKGESSAYEQLVKDKNGNSKWMLISGSPVFDGENKVVGSIGIHLDITDRKNQVTELTNARLKAEESVHSKEIFLANMSHEIRTPMNAIVGMTRLLEEMEMTDEQKKYLEAIKISSENLLVIINDILDFSKIDFGKIVLEKSVFPFYSVLENMMLLFESKAKEKKLVFKKTIDPNINVFFNADSGRLVQILTNLIGNSIKFTNEGEVCLTCELIEDLEEKQLIKFSVSDTGIGIEENKMETVFESFMQENSAINRTYGGTGLGLSISKQLVELFDGDLKVKSKKGKGSVFSFQIVLDKANQQDHTFLKNENIDTSQLKGKNVLLVEDNKMNQHLASKILEQLGVNVTIADNGYKGIEYMLDEDFDIVLMDLQMPGIDGMSATHMIRKKMKNKIPIIALTANAIIGDKEKCIAAGMNDYISKPFHKEELATKMLHLISQSTSRKNQSSAKENAEVLYNLEKLRKEVDGDEEIVRVMLDLFCELVTETIQNIDTAFADNNYEPIKKYAHKVKASLDTLEIRELRGIAQEIEDVIHFDDVILNKIIYFKDNLKYAQMLIKHNELMN